MPFSSNIVFFGTPSFARTILEAILKSGRSVPLIVTQPDRPAGRGQKLKSPEVKLFASDHKIKCIQPKKIKNAEFYEDLKRTGSKLFVVAAYGRILPTEILQIPKLTLNVHASLLPRWRGAAPIQRSILTGDKKTGVSIMRLVEELDAGDYMLQKEVQIDPNETAGELEGRLAHLGGKALVEALNQLDSNSSQFVKQDVHKVTFAPPIQVEEAKIDWSKVRGAVHNQIRAFSPNPGAFTKDGSTRIKIFKSKIAAEMKTALPPGTVNCSSDHLYIACLDGWIEILEIQKEGKTRQEIKQFLSGFRLQPNHRFG